MMYTIHGFQQKELVKMELDEKDALILRYFIDFKDSGKMHMRIINKKPFYWLKSSSLLEALPIINIRSTDALKRRLNKLVKAKVLEHCCVKEKGSYAFYTVGKAYEKLIDDSVEKTVKNKIKIAKSEHPTQKSSVGKSVNGKASDSLGLSNTISEHPTQKSGVGEQTGEHPTEKSYPVLPKSRTGYDSKVGTNNNSIKNYSIKNNNIKNNKKENEDVFVVVEEVIDYLNKKTNSNYRATNTETLRLIKMWLKDGYTINDFKLVIDKKTKEWIGTTYAQYLHPSTLFRKGKFETYLEQKEKINEAPKSNIRFNNFEPANYDYDDIEKKLLGWN